jgi:hypothetical protein
MNEVVQHAEVKVHSYFIQNRLQASVERLAILPHHQGGPDGTQALRRIWRHPRNKIIRLRAHLSLLPAPAAYAQGKTFADSSWEAASGQIEETVRTCAEPVEQVT